MGQTKQTRESRDEIMQYIPGWPAKSGGRGGKPRRRHRAAAERTWLPNEEWRGLPPRPVLTGSKYGAEIGGHHGTEQLMTGGGARLPSPKEMASVWGGGSDGVAGCIFGSWQIVGLVCMPVAGIPMLPIPGTWSVVLGIAQCSFHYLYSVLLFVVHCTVHQYGSYLFR